MGQRETLIYYPDSLPGIRRKRWGRGFSYFDPDGNRITCETTKDRLNALAVPPAYRHVWLCPDPLGHLQATGRDANGRKQYVYHPLWTRQRQHKKYKDLVRLADSLPRLRRWIASNLNGDAGEEATTLAAALALIDRASMRVGDPEYTRQNGSHGVSTLKQHHLDVEPGCVSLNYTAKGGREVEKRLTGKRLAEVLEASQDLPGAELLSWIDECGRQRRLTAEQINAKIAELCGEGITAKALRTWNGTHAAFMALSNGASTVKELASAASERLHNTPSIAQSSYIHPKVLNAVKAGKAVELTTDDRDGLRRGEADLARFLAD